MYCYITHYNYYSINVLCTICICIYICTILYCYLYYIMLFPILYFLNCFKANAVYWCILIRSLPIFLLLSAICIDVHLSDIGRFVNFGDLFLLSQSRIPYRIFSMEALTYLGLLNCLYTPFLMLVLFQCIAEAIRLTWLDDGFFFWPICTLPNSPH